MAFRYSRVFEPRSLAHADPAHDRHRRLVEQRRHRPDLAEAEPVECHAQRDARRLGGVAVMPGVLSEPPAHLKTAGAGRTGGHRAEPGEPDELAGICDLERPEAVAMLLETRLDAIDE